MTTIVGLDLSLTATGVARIVVPDQGATVTTVHRVVSKPKPRRRGDPPPTLAERSLRLRRVAGDVVTLCTDASLVVVEGPAYSKSEAGTWDRAGLWWLILARLTGAYKMPVIEADPTSVKTYALGKGGGAGTGKDEVLAAVIRSYMPVVEVPGNNEADALVLAAMGARFTGHAIEPGDLPQTHTKALDRIRWAT